MRRDARIRKTLAALAEVNASLRERHAAIHVDVGLRERAGVITNELALRMFVPHAKTDAPPVGARVPTRLLDMRTDVISVAQWMGPPAPHTPRVIRPIVGGASIGGNDPGFGTLTLVVRGGDGAEYGLTASHVVQLHGPVWQPSRSDGPDAAVVGSVVAIHGLSRVALVRLEVAGAIGAMNDGTRISRVAGAADISRMIASRLPLRLLGRTGTSEALLTGLDPQGMLAFGPIDPAASIPISRPGDSGGAWILGDMLVGVHQAAEQAFPISYATMVAPAFKVWRLGLN